MSPPDVVYVVRPGENNAELRWSLRSLSNLPHGRVWIAGYMPKWVTGAGHIPAPTMPRGRSQAKANLRAACEQPEVSDSFVYMCDDVFLMQPMDNLPAMHRGPVADILRSSSMASSYLRALDKTRQVLADRGITDPLMYDLHGPMLVTKRGMLEALDLCATALMHELTLYGNLNRIGGERRHNYKVRRQQHGWESWPFLSTNDSSFAGQPVGRFIRSRFDGMSPYEATPPPAEPAPRPPRRPIRYRAALRQQAVQVPA